MRVLIVFHGRLPGGPYPAAGIAVRAFTNGLGLQSAGLEVFYASRRRDLTGPAVPGQPPVFPFEGKAELLAATKTLAPDLILLEGPYEMASVQELDIPIALDLFAPRVLEAQWEDLDISQEMLSLLNAMSRADYFLVTSERQRHYYLGAMTLAGVDCREDRIATVPLAVAGPVPVRAPAPDPLFVAGGVAWPWQDPRWALELVVARLREAERGTLHLLRGAYPLGTTSNVMAPLPVEDVPPVHVHSLLSHDEMDRLLSTAWSIVDVSAPNLEREMALSFRQLDALRCGVPLVLGAHVPLAGLVSELEAGWVVSYGDRTGLERALDEILEGPDEVERRGANARRMGEAHFAAPVAIKALLERIQQPSRRRGRETLVAAMSRRATEAEAQETRLAGLERENKVLQADLRKKDRENKALDARMRELMDTVGKLSTSLEAALYLQENASVQLSGRQDALETELSGCQRALAAARRDIAKKQGEQEKLLLQRDQLESEVSKIAQDAADARARGDAARLEAAQLRGRMEVLEGQLNAAESTVVSLRGEVDKKQQEIEQLWATRDRLNEDLAQLMARLRASDGERATVEAREKTQIEALESALEAEKAKGWAWKEKLAVAEDALKAAREEVEQLLVRVKEKEAALEARTVAGALRKARAGLGVIFPDTRHRT